ncbi:MAG: trigger factor [Anaerolineae bacterium]|nr:trigger factor [Anaerolineae bacterium]
MATQVEHLENHTARLTVDVPKDRFEKAMQSAAKRISGQLNIPGFRRGKAPYPVVLRYVGPQALVEEAMDKLSQDVYRDALTESKIEPYAPGEVEAVETDPEVVIKFLVAKQPEVELGSYRDVRVPYEIPEVTDEEVNKTIEQMRESRAVVETVERPAQLGDQVKFHVYGDAFIPQDKEATEAAEGDAEKPAEAEASAAEEQPLMVEEFIDEDMDDTLDEDAEKDLVPGFSANIVGMKAGDEKTFRISLPADFRETRYAGHDVEFKVKVEEVRSRTLPELNDDFAKKSFNGETDNLLDFRIRVRKDLQEAAKRRYDNEYVDKVMGQMVEGAKLKYPEAMIDASIHEMIDSLDRNLRNSGLSLDYYMQVQKKTHEDLHEDYHDTAIQRIERSLLLGDIARAENITIDRDTIMARIDEMAESFGDQKDQFKKVLMSPENQQGIALDLLTDAAQKRIIAIGKGEAPELPAPAEVAATTEETPAANDTTTDAPADNAASSEAAE